MRVVSVLFGLCTNIMSDFGFNSRLSRVFEWLWSRLCFIWRCCATMILPMLGASARLLPITWRKDRGEGTRNKRAATAEDVEVQHEAAGSDLEPSCKRPRSEEEEEGEEMGENFDSEEYRVETTDEFYCDYDSTWETEQDEEDTFRRSRRPARSRHFKFSRFENAARDMQNYRHNYPNQAHHWGNQTDDKQNLNFYLGLKASQPDGVRITDFHKEWHGAYDILEYVHTYIQWLFPLQEPGMNYEASTLTKEEINDFLANRTAMQNLLTSYKLMLDFYGIELCDEKTGKVQRASNWRDRFNNLNSHSHNNLRITRILKCLGTLGYPQYQAPLVRFFLEETLVNGELPSVKDSVLNYFLFAVLEKTERRKLLRFAYDNYDRKDEFVWCPKKIQKLWSGPPLEYLSIESETPDREKEAGQLESESDNW